MRTFFALLMSISFVTAVVCVAFNYQQHEEYESLQFLALHARERSEFGADSMDKYEIMKAARHGRANLAIEAGIVGLIFLGITAALTPRKPK